MIHDAHDSRDIPFIIRYATRPNPFPWWLPNPFPAWLASPLFFSTMSYSAFSSTVGHYPSFLQRGWPPSFFSTVGHPFLFRHGWPPLPRSKPHSTNVLASHEFYQHNIVFTILSGATVCSLRSPTNLHPLASTSNELCVGSINVNSRS